MATEQLVGASDFIYTPSGLAQQTLLLAVPLLVAPAFGFSSARRRTLFEVWNDDGTIREQFTIGSAVDEVAATIRFENEPDKLRTMLRYGREEDVTLTYRPDGASGSTYPSKLVAVAGAPPGRIRISPDRERYAHGEWETTILLRRVDGGTFEGLL